MAKGFCRFKIYLPLKSNSSQWPVSEMGMKFPSPTEVKEHRHTWNPGNKSTQNFTLTTVISCRNKLLIISKPIDTARYTRHHMQNIVKNSLYKN